MVVPLNVTITGMTEQIRRLGRLAPQVIGEVEKAVQTQTLLLQAHVVRDKLSGQVLNVVTGALRRSIQQMVWRIGDVVFGRVYSAGDVKYAGIHEFGGKTPAHDIYPTKAQALHFALGGVEVFAKVVHHPGSTMPERSYMRSGLNDRRDPIVEAIRQAAILGARTV